MQHKCLWEQLSHGLNAEPAPTAQPEDKIPSGSASPSWEFLRNSTQQSTGSLLLLTFTTLHLFLLPAWNALSTHQPSPIHSMLQFSSPQVQEFPNFRSHRSSSFPNWDLWIPAGKHQFSGCPGALFWQQFQASNWLKTTCRVCKGLVKWMCGAQDTEALRLMEITSSLCRSHHIKHRKPLKCPHSCLWAHGLSPRIFS